MGWFTPEQRFKRSVRKHVIVHTRDGYSLDGVLHGLYADGVELGDATFIRTDDSDTPLDGTQIIPWVSISWVQELNGAGPRAENA